MKNQGIGQTIDSLNDDFLENIINNHFSFDSEDMDAVDKVLVYRQICIRLSIALRISGPGRRFARKGSNHGKSVLMENLFPLAPSLWRFLLKASTVPSRFLLH